MKVSEFIELLKQQPQDATVLLCEERILSWGWPPHVEFHDSTYSDESGMELTALEFEERFPNGVVELCGKDHVPE